jgi:hypothetical protein
MFEAGCALAECLFLTGASPQPRIIEIFAICWGYLPVSRALLKQTESTPDVMRSMRSFLTSQSKETACLAQKMCSWISLRYMLSIWTCSYEFPDFTCASKYSLRRSLPSKNAALDCMPVRP